MGSASGPTDHEGPKINGSAAAFYALIIALSLVIAVAFGAVLYLWLEEKAHRRGVHKPVGDEEDTSYRPTPSWCKRIFGMGSNGHSRGTARDIDTSRRGQGWIQAGTTDEWESEIAEYSKPNRPPSFVPKEYSPSINTKRTSATYSLPQRSLVHSFISDRSSVLHSADLHGLPYEDTSAPSIRHSIPSIYSQLLPPSSGPASFPTHQSNCSISTVSATPVRISTSPPLPSSPVSIEYAPSDSQHGSEYSHRPSLRTFGGGTKFIEAL